MNCQYCLEEVRELSGSGYEARIVGPGIGRSGIDYHVDSLEEANLLVENLNSAYLASKYFRSFRNDQSNRNRFYAAERTPARTIG